MKLTEQKLLQICKHQEFEQIEIKDYLHQLFHYGSVTTRHGEIRFCEDCNDFVQTTCHGCGCGNCTKCEAQWSCYMGYVGQKLPPASLVSNNGYLDSFV